MQQGRRTASLKASIEAINLGSPMLGADIGPLGLSGPSNYLLADRSDARRRQRMPNHFDAGKIQLVHRTKHV